MRSHPSFTPKGHALAPGQQPAPAAFSSRRLRSVEQSAFTLRDFSEFTSSWQDPALASFCRCVWLRDCSPDERRAGWQPAPSERHQRACRGGCPLTSPTAATVPQPELASRGHPLQVWPATGPRRPLRHRLKCQLALLPLPLGRLAPALPSAWRRWPPGAFGGASHRRVPTGPITSPHFTDGAASSSKKEQQPGVRQGRNKSFRPLLEQCKLS